MKKILTQLFEKLYFYIILSLLLNLAIIHAIGWWLERANDTGLSALKQTRNIDLFEIQGMIEKTRPKIKQSLKKEAIRSTHENDKNNLTGAATNQALSNLQAVVTNESTTNMTEASNLLIESNILMTNKALFASGSEAKTNGAADETPGTNSDSTNAAFALFNIGERLSYDIEVQVDQMPYIKGVVGNVDIDVLEITNVRGRPVYHCSADVRSLDSIINIYVLRDIFHTWFDADMLQTYQIVKLVKEGGWLDNVTNLFYSDEGYGVYYNKNSPDGNRYDMLAHSYDIITLLFFLRITDKSAPIRINWVADFGQKKELNIVFGEGEDLEIPINGKKEKVKTITATEKDTGINIYLARDYDCMPIRAVIPAFHIIGYTINLNATFKKYTPGQKTQKSW